MRDIETIEGLGNINDIAIQLESFSDEEKQLFVGNLERQEPIQVIIEEIDGNPNIDEEKNSEKYKDSLLQAYRNVSSELSKFENVEGFDPKETKEKAMKALVFVLSNKDIPDEVKDKMLIDFGSAVAEIKKADLSKIGALKKLRSSMSFGLNKEETDGDYLQIIIGQVFTNAITMKASVISRCFLDETEKMGGTEYHKETLDTLRKDISELDEEFGLDIASIIGEGIERNSNMKVLNNILDASDVSKGERKHIIQEFTIEDDDNPTHIDITIGGKPYDLIDLLAKYDDIFGKFKKGQNSQFTNIRRDILDDGDQWLEGKTEDLVGMEKIDTDIDIENEFQGKLEKMNLADLVIILNQLAGIAPIYGGIQDISVAYTGIEADGRLPGGFERTFLLIVGALDASLVGSGFAKLSKSGKLKKYISLLGKVKDAFTRREILEEIIALGNSNAVQRLVKLVPGLEERLNARKLARVDNNVDAISKEGRVIDDVAEVEKTPNKLEDLSKFLDKDINPKTLRYLDNNLDARLKLFHESLSRQIDNMASIGTNPNIIKSAKEFINQMLLNPKISTDVIIHIARTKKIWGEKLSGNGINSLTHVLESIITSAKIPKNKSISELLKTRYGNISQTEFFSIVTLHHDLEKNTLPVNYIQNFEDLFKGKNLSSHQLDSANLLRSSIKEGKASDVYNSIESFLIQKGIDTGKTDEFINLIADIIEGHAGNTQFIQMDTISGLKRIGKNSVNITNSIQGLKIQGQKKHIITFLGDLGKNGALEGRQVSDLTNQIKDCKSLKEMIDIINFSLISKYLKVNLGKDINIDTTDMKNILSLIENYPKRIDKNLEITTLLNSDTTTIPRIRSIIAEKNAEAEIHIDNLNRYIHTSELEDSGEEAARFVFNINDIIGYANPSSESFIKLIGFNHIKNLISSPMDSAMASLSELKFALFNKRDIIDVEEYEKMYKKGVENLGRLTDTYREKMQEPIGDDAPDEIKELGSTFGEAYANASKLNSNKGDAPDDIKAFFINAFTNMCKNL